MAERLETLPAKQVAWVLFLFPARPMFSVEKWHFSVTLRPGARCKHGNCTVKLDKKIAVASSLWRLEVGLSVLTRVISQTRCPRSGFKLKTVESKGVTHLKAWEYRIQKTAC
jgi:hypothetical protein